MSHDHITWALNQKLPNTDSRLLLLVLAHYTGDAGTFCCGTEALARLTGMDPFVLGVAFAMLMEASVLQESSWEKPGEVEGCLALQLEVSSR